MSRVNVYERVSEQDLGYEAPKLAGWFEWSKAARWSDADYNHNGSGGTGRGQAVMLTAGGRWVLEHWTIWQGGTDRYEYITDDEARDWLLRNGEDEAVRQHFGEVAEEEDRRGGRPEIGGRITTAIGDERLAVVDSYARSEGIGRAEAVRRLVDAGLERAAR